MSETRKLQQIGGSTLYVSLPKQWISSMQLKQGDRVTLVSRSDGLITVFPTNKEEKPREITLVVNTEDSTQSLKREITAAYVDGFDAIKLKAERNITEEQQDVIREIVDDLFGLEIVEVTGSAITIQCLLNHDLPIEKTMQRIHNVIISMFSETLHSLREKDTDLIKGLTRRNYDVRRLSLVTNRLLRSFILFPRPAEEREINLIDCVDYLRILHIISEIAGNVSKISESVVALGEHMLPESILEPLSQEFILIRSLYDQSIHALLLKDIPLANRILDNALTLEDLWKLCIDVDEKSETSCLVLSYAYLIIDNLKQIQQYAVEIAEIAIDRAEATIPDNTE